MQCPACGSQDIDYNDAGGESLCTNCGCVLEENTIVSSIEFAENTNGASSVIGQFVSATSTQPFRSRRAGGYGYSGREPREVTLNKGRRNISNVAAVMGLSSVHFILFAALPTQQRCRLIALC